MGRIFLGLLALLELLLLYRMGRIFLGKRKQCFLPIPTCSWPNANATALNILSRLRPHRSTLNFRKNRSVTDSHHCCPYNWFVTTLLLSCVTLKPPNNRLPGWNGANNKKCCRFFPHCWNFGNWVKQVSASWNVNIYEWDFISAPEAVELVWKAGSAFTTDFTGNMLIQLLDLRTPSLRTSNCWQWLAKRRREDVTNSGLIFAISKLIYGTCTSEEEESRNR